MHSTLDAAHVVVGQRGAGSQLVASAQTLFASMGSMNGSIYQMFAMLLPDCFRPLLAWSAHAFPDARFSAVLQARATISSASMQLVQQFKQRQQEQQAGAGDATGNAGPGGSTADAAIRDSSSSSRVQRSSGAIAPGSFLGLLLSARGGATGHGLSDLQMIMQVRGGQAGWLA
jgi:hypothetical protein